MIKIEFNTKEFVAVKTTDCIVALVNNIEIDRQCLLNYKCMFIKIESVKPYRPQELYATFSFEHYNEKEGVKDLINFFEKHFKKINVNFLLKSYFSEPKVCQRYTVYRQNPNKILVDFLLG